MQEHALSYLELGMNVLPVNSNKQPKLPSWKRYQNVGVTEKNVKTWWEKWPDASIAIITGKISNVVVIDIDSEEGLKHLEPYLEQKTLTCVTGGGGQHLYFQHPGGEVPNVVELLPGVDVRGDGGYVVVPPSHHQSGRRYYWLDPDVDIAPLPQKLLQLILKRGRRRLSSQDWEEDLPKGKRDEEVTRRAGKLFQAGLSTKEVLSMLKIWNQRHCKPSLSEEQIVKIVNSIAGREKTKQEENKDNSGSSEFRVMSFADTLSKYGFGEVTWTIQDWLPEATCGLIVAPPGNYKTWLLLDLAISIATGKDFLGEYRVDHTGPVLVVQQEDPFPMLFNRIGVIMNLGEPQQVGDCYVVPVPPSMPNIYWHTDRALNFKDENSMEGLRQAISQIKPKLVILDPLYSAADSKDYMAEGAQAMLALKKMRDDFNCSFMIAHHTTKSGASTGERESLWGSQFLNAWLETGWQVRPVQGDEQSIKIRRHFKGSAIPITLNLSFEITDWSFGIKTEEDTKQASNETMVETLETNISSDQRQIAKKMEIAGLDVASRIFDGIRKTKKEEGEDNHAD